MLFIPILCIRFTRFRGSSVCAPDTDLDLATQVTPSHWSSQSQTMATPGSASSDSAAGILAIPASAGQPVRPSPRKTKDTPDPTSCPRRRTHGHTKAHASGAASIALNSIFGKNFAFDDTTELPFGIPMRHFESFDAAADEAAISRMYGGIHYRSAVEVGVQQGRSLGNYVVANLTMKSK